MGFITVPLVASDNSADTSTLYVNSANIERIRAATTKEIAQWPSALTSMTVLVRDSTTPRTRQYLTSATTASVVAAANSSLGVANSGQTTLVAGTKAITIPGLTTSNLGFVSLVASNTGSSTVTYQAVCTANTLTLRANVAAGTINASDVSTVNYFVI